MPASFVFPSWECTNITSAAKLTFMTPNTLNYSKPKSWSTAPIAGAVIIIISVFATILRTTCLIVHKSIIILILESLIFEGALWLPPTVTHPNNQTHASLVNWWYWIEPKSECAWSFVFFVSVLALWWTDDLSRVHSASSLMAAEIGSTLGSKSKSSEFLLNVNTTLYDIQSFNLAKVGFYFKLLKFPKCYCHTQPTLVLKL